MRWRANGTAARRCAKRAPAAAGAPAQTSARRVFWAPDRAPDCSRKGPGELTKIVARPARKAPKKMNEKARGTARHRSRREREIGDFHIAVGELGASGAKKIKRIIAHQLRTDKVFVYFT